MMARAVDISLPVFLKGFRETTSFKSTQQELHLHLETYGVKCLLASEQCLNS